MAIYNVTVVVPTEVENAIDCPDRIRWYLDHAVRGYWQQFAHDTDPIRGMRRASLLIKKEPARITVEAPMPDLSSLAASLTEAQRRYLTGEMRSLFNPPIFFIAGIDAASRRTLPTRTVLTRLGLLQNGRTGPTTLTETGLALRAYLKGQSDD
ncbi:hypothetical protein BSL82_09415 [Tardibacter chloracetimidivorans]|uniref:Uncharacterized protein n=1 Tax=Tardibacter chloracetimidivorans TaxID=1921510 RepID=A0A1L3ZV44_9SPHN|nr:hypothetical protein [Tardibacter chloracetimidivorans]API59498.1 hypothetical protein BSL82_09415 [Tardibacter chloracetimidivorans]